MSISSLDLVSGSAVLVGGVALPVVLLLSTLTRLLLRPVEHCDPGTGLVVLYQAFYQLRKSGGI